MADKSKTVEYRAVLEDDTKKGAKSVEKTIGKTTKKVEKSFVSMGAGISAAIGAIGFAKLASDFVQVNKEFQSLNATLITVTGSSEKATAAFANLETFARNTPFQLNEVVKGFAKMKALGLDPTNEALTSFGNTASSMGLSLNQMIEAVADASTGEFERLKEFGIKASKQGEEITFTFQGVKTTIENDAMAIQGFLVNLGNTKFAGGMARQMDTLGGALSNLSDNYDALFRKIGEGSAGTNLTNSIKDFSDTISSPAFMGGMSLIAQTALALVSAAAAGVKFIGLAGERPVNIQDDATQQMLLSARNFGRQGVAPQLERTGIIEQSRGPQAFETPELDFGTLGPMGSAAALAFAQGEEARANEIQAATQFNQIELDMVISQGQALSDMRISFLQGKVEAEKRADEQILESNRFTNMNRLQMAESTSNSMLSLQQSVFAISGKQNEAFFKLTQGVGVATAVINMWQGVAAGVKLGYPAAIPAVAAALAQGGVAIANIKAAKVGSGGGGAASGGGGFGVPDSGNVQTQPVPTQVPQTQGSLTIVVQGNIVGEDVWVQERLIPAINDAANRNVNIEFAGAT